MKSPKQRPAKSPVSSGDRRSAPTPLPAWTRRDWLLALLLTLGTALAYWPIRHAGFIWDDNSMLTSNRLVQKASGLYDIWFSTTLPDYFPMTSTSLWLEWRLWGLNATGYHVTNLLLHIASSLMLWRVLRALRVPGAWLAAALFAVHPVNVESVAWIAERKNTLCLFFSMASVWCYLRCEAMASQLRRYYLAALGLFFLALLSKTAVVMLPCVLLCFIWWRDQKIGRAALKKAAPFFLVSLVLGVVTLWFQSHRAIGADIIRTESFPARVALVGRAFWFYLGKAVAPTGLCFIYPRWQIDAHSVLAWLPLAGFFLALALFWRGRRSWGRSLLLTMVCYFLLLLPILGLVNIYFQMFSLVADHWQYFAIICPLVLISASLTRWLRRSPALQTAAVALPVLLGVLTWNQCGMYLNSNTVWNETLRANPSAWVAHSNLGLDMLNDNQADQAIVHFQKTLEFKPDHVETWMNLGNAHLQKGQIEEAARDYKKGLEINPTFAGGYYNLGTLAMKEARTNEAIELFEKAVQLKPEHAPAHLSLGNIFTQTSRLNEAMQEYQKAIEGDPNFAPAYYNLGNTLADMGRMDEAVAEYQKAVALRPDLASGAFLNLGNHYVRLGKVNEAVAYYQKVLAINPNQPEALHNFGLCFFFAGKLEEAKSLYEKALACQPDYADAQKDLAWVLATSPQAVLRDGAKAVALGERAARLTGGRDPFVLCALAAAYAEAGRFPEAVATGEEALRQTEAQKNTPLADQLKTQLQFYRTRQPFRAATHS